MRPKSPTRASRRETTVALAAVRPSTSVGNRSESRAAAARRSRAAASGETPGARRAMRVDTHQLSSVPTVVPGSTSWGTHKRVRASRGRKSAGMTPTTV